ncbi:hypothetical protein [Candidatus Similichlamydia epinepheli]|uniref:hypothetical protein n=1 Tax=Candidatus Similichlamydia epinepheli TaxID=1903953 RepID=UPI0013007202|nr:hypothetical protein [Candidatus Similichlamydia epinepheli]
MNGRVAQQITAKSRATRQITTKTVLDNPLWLKSPLFLFGGLLPLLPAPDELDEVRDE